MECHGRYDVELSGYAQLYHAAYCINSERTLVSRRITLRPHEVRGCAWGRPRRQDQIKGSPVGLGTDKKLMNTTSKAIHRLVLGHQSTTENLAGSLSSMEHP